MIKKTVLIFISVLLLCQGVCASEPSISAQCAAVYDVDSGRFLYCKAHTSRMLIASTTKIMTALVAIENCPLDAQIKVTAQSARTEGSSIYLKEGESISMETALYGLLLNSGNDAAMAIAIHCGGSVEGFVDMMNIRAEELGLDETCFDNPCGLDGESNYSCARDLCLLAAEAMKNNIFSKIVATKSITLGDRHFVNHNKLLWNVEDADGIKTGYTKASGRTLVSSTLRNGKRLIAVTLNAPDDWNDHKKLIESCFNDYETKLLCEANSLFGYLPIVSGMSGSAGVHFEKTFSYPIRQDEKITTEIYLPYFAYAPVNKGESAGRVVYLIDGKHIGEVRLLYGETVPGSTPPSIWEIFKKTLKDPNLWQYYKYYPYYYH